MEKKLFLKLLMMTILMEWGFSERLPTVQDGLKLSLLERVAGARQMAGDGEGHLFVGTTGSTVEVLTLNAQQLVTSRQTIKVGDIATGVEYRNGSLYIGTLGKLWVIEGINQLLKDGKSLEQSLTPLYILPMERHHGRRYLRFSPSGELYMGIGAPCNICKTVNPMGSIVRFDGLGGIEVKMTVVATGIRNTVGMDFFPEDGKLWFTDNGRDNMGDATPPDELNTLDVRVGGDGKVPFYGYPYVHGNGVMDPQFVAVSSYAYIKPEYNFKAHVATLGVHYYKGSMLSNKYHHGIFVAKHGSWDSSVPVGYEVSFVFIENGKARGEERFMWGFSGGDHEIYGRPVDIYELEDGSLLVSDDNKGRIYRISK